MHVSLAVDSSKTRVITSSNFVTQNAPDALLEFHTNSSDFRCGLLEVTVHARACICQCSIPVLFLVYSQGQGHRWWSVQVVVTAEVAALKLRL